MNYQPLPGLPITPGPWLPRRSHEDHAGPLFDIDPEEKAEYEARPFTSIVSAAGQTVVNAHDLFQFRNPLDAHAVAKVPDLLQIAVWAEAALGYLSSSAKTAADRAEFARRFGETSAVLQELRAVATPAPRPA